MNDTINDNDKFVYTYSAPTENERREIESIKKQYESVPKQESKLDELRKLDRRVMRTPLIVALTIGIFGVLVMGTGMAMVLEWELMLWGVIVGVIGLAVAAAAYPVYSAVLKGNKRKYGQKIIELSNKLLNEEIDKQ